MAFKLKSGNKTPFKMMGSYSPMKENGKTKTNEQAKKTTSKKKTREEYLKEGFSQREADQMYRNQAVTGYDMQKQGKQDFEPAYEGADYSQKDIDKMTRKEKEMKIDGYDPKLDKKAVPKPKKSTTSKHGQLNDAEKEYETDKKLYDKYMEGKKKKKSSPNKKTEGKYKDSKSTSDGGSTDAKKSNKDTGGSTGSRKSGRMDLKKLKKLAEKGAKEATTTKPKGKEQSGESPAKNYKNPQDYKVFNMGNKPTPVKKHKKY
jgi:hypothetical protein